MRLLGGRQTLVLAALVAVALAGCGSSSSLSTTSSTAASNPAAEAGAQRHAEEIFERQGLDYYIGELRASTVRFAHPCKAAEKEEEKAVPGEWDCEGWGLVSVQGGDDASPGQCRVVEGNVKATGLVGKPSGEAEDFHGSLCELDFGFGRPGKKPRATLVAAWERKQKAEIANVKAQEESPAGREAEHERNQEEAEETQRSREAEGVE
jgi:hypothetical protein